MMKLFFALFFVTTIVVAAQTPQVPHKMQFADITLTIRDDARQEIQKDVDAFTRYQNSFNVKVERARTYFPIIEKIFAEENVPDDFKYLVIQESALIADAVSVSNAVGFWQFKDFTAIEMGLRVDKEVDERLNIVSSSRAAARYLKKNNGFFNNWLYALQSYQMGAGGVMRSEKDSKSGSKHIEITGKTYWYVKKFLAHKIAYEGAITGAGKMQVLTYQNQKRKSLSDLAKEVAVDEDDLKAYNKWAKSGIIPDDRTYTVLIPVVGSGTDAKVASVIASSQSASQPAAAATEVSKREVAVKINGISTIRAREGENAAKLAARAGEALSSFLRWNDLSVGDAIKPGQLYLLGKKRVRATKAYHKVEPGEDLWSISQQYGLQMKKLKRYNRIDEAGDLKPGMTLWLSSMKPKNSDRVPEAAVVEVSNGDTFAWEDAQPATAAAQSVPVRVQPVVPVVESRGPQTITSTPQEHVRDSVEIAAVVPDPSDSVETLQEKTKTTVPKDSVKQQTEDGIVVAKKTEHIVQAGETLYGIARQHSVTVMDLVQWNSLDLQQGIKPGQVLKLSDDQVVAASATATAQAREIVHEVRPSDTVYSIARKYGVTIKELMEWNNKKDFALAVGEKLRVFSK